VVYIDETVDHRNSPLTLSYSSEFHKDASFNNPRSIQHNATTPLLPHASSLWVLTAGKVGNHRRSLRSAPFLRIRLFRRGNPVKRTASYNPRTGTQEFQGIIQSFLFHLFHLFTNPLGRYVINGPDVTAARREWGGAAPLNPRRNRNRGQKTTEQREERRCGWFQVGTFL
jgi:hypothetical protein